MEELDEYPKNSGEYGNILRKMMGAFRQKKGGLKKRTMEQPNRENWMSE